MRISTSMRWLVVVAGAAMLLAVAAACAGETVEVPGETVVVEKVVTETVEVPGETVVVEKEVIKTVEVPGETVTKEVVKEVMVPGETVVVEKEVVKTVEVPGQTVVKEVVKTVEVPGQTVVVEKEVVKTVEVPGQTVVVEKVVVQEVAGKKYVTDPTTGKVVSAPEYGGTLTYAYKSVGTTLDPAFEGHRAGHLLSAVNEKLGIPDWGVDREVEDFRGWYQPTEVFKGHLAESWDISADGRTYIFHIRQGVHWHDKEPMNGRELTADDIVYNLMRYAGLTDFVPPRTYEMIDLPIESIEATDKYTVVIKLSEPRLAALRVFINEVNAWMLPPDVIEEHGDHKDWRNVVGTGPLMLTDYVEGVSSTRTKNPDYWGYDEKYPENRLPYVDQLRGLFMEEEATRLAAMRTGKIDLLHTVGGGTTIKVLDTVRSLQKTNPEIQVTPGFIRSMNTVGMNIRKPPFDDINVRRAMQMALDLETINATYFGGYAKWKPQGIIGDANVGYYIPFEEWPEEVKQYFRYDPEGAEALLDAAGYPRGADGIRFKTTLDFWDVRDLAYTEITAGYWDEIGVDVEINVYETIPWATGRAEMTYQLTSGDAGFDQVPSVVIGWYTAIKYRAGGLGDHVGEYLGGVEDPTLDRLYEAFQVATTVEEQQRIFREFDMYYVSRSTQVWGPKAPFFQAVQPWVIGFSGENFLGDMDTSLPLVRLWIDSELKEAMGY